MEEDYEQAAAHTCSPRAHTHRLADGIICAGLTCCTGNHTLRPEFVSSALAVLATTLPPTAAAATTAPVSSASAAVPPLNKGSSVCRALRSRHSLTRLTDCFAGIIAASRSQPPPQPLSRAQLPLLPPHDDARWQAAGCSGYRWGKI
jgi:phage tail sheath gpL-like